MWSALGNILVFFVLFCMIDDVIELAFALLVVVGMIFFGSIEALVNLLLAGPRWIRARLHKRVQL